MVLCKSWVYTHRLPPLGSTHNMRHYLIVCVCLCMWGGYVSMCVWTYNGDTSQLHFTHKDMSAHYTDSIHTIYCSERWFKRDQIIYPRCKIAQGFPMKWQLHWLTVTPSQWQFYYTHTPIHQSQHIVLHLYTRGTSVIVHLTSQLCYLNKNHDRSWRGTNMNF